MLTSLSHHNLGLIQQQQKLYLFLNERITASLSVIWGLTETDHSHRYSLKISILLLFCRSGKISICLQRKIASHSPYNFAPYLPETRQWIQHRHQPSSTRHPVHLTLATSSNCLVLLEAKETHQGFQSRLHTCSNRNGDISVPGWADSTVG